MKRLALTFAVSAAVLFGVVSCTPTMTPSTTSSTSSSTSAMGQSAREAYVTGAFQGVDGLDPDQYPSGATFELFAEAGWTGFALNQKERFCVAMALLPDPQVVPNPTRADATVVAGSTKCNDVPPDQLSPVVTPPVTLPATLPAGKVLVVPARVDPTTGALKSLAPSVDIRVRW